MIEILIGLSTAVCILIAYVVYLIKKNGRLETEKKQLTGMIDSIDKAHDFISQELAKEKLNEAENEDNIVNRNYFSD